MPRTGNRPAVLLTQARIDRPSPALTPLERVYLSRVMGHHGQPNRDRLAYACLDCGSIGECADQAARDSNAKHIDYTCCDSATTVLFRTEPV